MKLKIQFLIICFGVLHAPKQIFSQQKNSISIQTGLFHCYFDKSPILNLNYQYKSRRYLFNNLLYNSLGINYKRILNEKSSIGIEYSIFRELYPNQIDLNFHKPLVSQKGWFTFSINYERNLILTPKLSISSGAGINYRDGQELYILSMGILGYYGNIPIYESHVTSVEKKDIGLNLNLGLNYKIFNRFFCYSKIDFLGFVYLYDKVGIKKIQEEYKSPQFPSRYDLSLKLGIGYKF
jgi:hypothetical protein